MGKAPLGAPGQPDYGMQMMKLVSMMNESKYNKERAAYYGAEKEARIADTRAKTQEREEKAIGQEAESEFSGETGIDYDPKKDKATIAPFLAAKKAARPTSTEPMRREDEGPISKIVSLFKPSQPAPTTPGEDPDITQGRIMGTKAALVPQLYEQAQKQVQDAGYADPKSPMYSPEAARMAGTRTMRPEDVDAAAKGFGVIKEQQAKGRKELAEAQTKELGLTVAQENRRLAEIITNTDPRDTKTINAALTRMATNNGNPSDVMKWKKEQREGYLAATKGANEAYEKLLKAQKDFPDKIDYHASLAAEASKGNIDAADLVNAPMTDLVTAHSYNALNPFSGKYTLSNRVKVPTDYAKAERDGVIPAMVRAPLNPKDGIWEQRAQIDKQGAYYAWEIIRNNPEYLGNPKSFEAAVDKDEAIPGHIKVAAKAHMGMYMQMNQDTRSDADKLDAQRPQGPQNQPQGWGGANPETGEGMPAVPLPGLEPVKRAVGRGLEIAHDVLEGPPPGGRPVPEGPQQQRPGFLESLKGAPADVPLEPPIERSAPTPPTEMPSMELAPPPKPRGSNLPTLPTIKGVAPASASIPPPTAPGANASLIDAMIKVESSGRPGAVGSKGEVGLMQLRETAAKEMGLNPDERKDPVKNRAAGTKYIEKQIKRFGSVEKGLAAYNWGPDNLEKAIAERGDRWMEALPESTVNYIKKVLASR